MQEPQLERLTRAIVESSLDVLEAAVLDPARDADLVGTLSRRVHGILHEELAAGPRSRDGLADELALTVYLTLAELRQPSPVGPGLLLCLARHLEPVVGTLGTEADSTVKSLEEVK